MSYASIGNFGNSKRFPSSDPMTIIASTELNSGFQNVLGGSYLRPQGEQAQRYAAQWCATVGWNGVCEVLSQNNNRTYPNMSANCNGPNGACTGPGIGNALTAGQMLIRNTAAEKYLRAMSSNCIREYEPFDPTTADSPLMSRWVARGDQCKGGKCDGRGTCVPVYGVDPFTIDDDPVMNKILQQPWIAMDILINIYNHAKSNEELRLLQDTKLGKFFESSYFQNSLKYGAYRTS